jgi:zinc D-Ala-D-Ala carboxypeptidase
MESRTRRRRTAAIPFILLAVAGAVTAAVIAIAPVSGAGASAVADGEIGRGDRVSVHDIQLPALANLDPELLAAVQRAALDATADGVEFVVTSGWRSPEYQARLLSEAVSEYGSEEEAARWTATPQTSLHVSGDAIDIGDFDATYWLSLHGAAYGLCQIYTNEPWHFELRPEAASAGCPEQYPDPTHDPRMLPEA